MQNRHEISCVAPAFAWLKAMPIAPKAGHIRELLDRLHLVRGVGVPAGNAGRVYEDRLQQFVREGHASDAHQLGRYSEHRRRAILVATVSVVHGSGLQAH